MHFSYDPLAPLATELISTFINLTRLWCEVRPEETPNLVKMAKTCPKAKSGLAGSLGAFVLGIFRQEKTEKNQKQRKACQGH